MKDIWKTKDGKELKITDLDDYHLINIIKLIRNKAINGLAVRSGGGSSPEDFWYEEDVLYGEDVFNHFKAYKNLIIEAKYRKLDI